MLNPELVVVKSSDAIATILFFSLLLIASTFIGIPLNGGDKGWLYINGFFREFIAGDWNVFDEPLYILVLISTVVLYLTPFFFLSKYRKKIFMIIPGIYLLLTLISFPLFIFLLIPFILVWVILLTAVKKYDKA